MTKIENRKDMFKRTVLSEVIPLQTPYKVHIDVANACNFKCVFCFHSHDDETLRRSGFTPGIMGMDLFESLIDQLGAFPDRVKCLGLTGLGEPLLNRDLPAMLRLAKRAAVADKVVITTNGSLLTPALSDSLVEGGLDEIIISVEALTDKKYYEITGRKVSVPKFIENIRYLYEHRGRCKVFCKIVNLAFDEEEDESRFHDIFDGLGDLAYVEKVIPQFPSVDYEALGSEYQGDLYGKDLMPVEICSMIFYAMQISTSGNVCPCCVDYNETVVLGNAKTSDLYSIWNGEAFNRFRRAHLQRERESFSLCRNCNYLVYNVRAEDILDGAEDGIIDRMNKR